MKRWIYFFGFSLIVIGLVKGNTFVPGLIMQGKGYVESIILSHLPDIDMDHSTTQIVETKKDIPPTNGQTGILGIAIGQSSKDVLSTLGEPQRKEPSAFGYDWWIYNKDLSHYVQVGIQDNRVVDLYSSSPSWQFRSMKKGATHDQLKETFSFQPTVSFSYDGATFTLTNVLDERALVMIDNIPTLFYLDKHDRKKVVAIRFMDKEWLVKTKLYSIEWTYYGKPPYVSPPGLSKEQQNKVQRVNEKQIFDLVNVVRAEYKLPILQWNEGAAEVARGHSLDMLEHHFFDHVSATTGLDPFQRMKKKGVKFRTAGENIAMGYMDAIEVHHGWMNSQGHRKNILNPNFSTLGVGVVSTYSTQNFVTP